MKTVITDAEKIFEEGTKEDLQEYILNGEDLYIVQPPELSDWKCHLFGSQGDGITYVPAEGCVPNFFTRWLMKVCFACTWVKCS